MSTRLAALLALLLLAAPAPALAAAAAIGAPAQIVSTTAVASGFHALSVTFASPTEGWVLGTAPCGTTRCLAVAHTLDAGHTWSALPAPAISRTAVASIRFANSHDGWVFGPELWATHNGGHTWTHVLVTGLPGGTVLALETAAGIAHAVLYDGASTFRIATAHVASNTWTLASTRLGAGAGPIPELQIVLSGANGWILQNDRTVVNGARLIHGVWHTWNPACGIVVGPAIIAASSSSNMIAVCDVGLFSTPTGEHLYVSSNAGFSFTRTGSTLPVESVNGAATPSPSTIVVAAEASTGQVLEASFNGGATWSRVRTLGGSDATDLGFTTASQGVVVASGGLYMTRNGGHTWSRVTF